MGGQLAAEEHGGVDGFPVLQQVPASAFTPDSEVRGRRRNKIGDQIISLLMIGPAELNDSIVNLLSSKYEHTAFAISNYICSYNSSIYGVFLNVVFLCVFHVFVHPEKERPSIKPCLATDVDGRSLLVFLSCSGEERRYVRFALSAA